MELYSYILSLCEKGENTEVEFKSALGGFPNSFWETYSAFGNTAGGIIVLGIKEKNHKFTPDHLTAEQVAKYKKQYWDDVHNKNKVSTCLTADDDVMESDYDGSIVLIVKISRAVYSKRPVFLTRNPFGHTYVRRYEGDYVVDDDTVSRMFAESNIDKTPLDLHIVKGCSIGNRIDATTIRQYRQLFDIKHENHPWSSLDDMGFLRKIGAYCANEETGEEGFTLAGVLMFGTYDGLEAAIPGYFIDYREKLSSEPGIRWTDRVYPDGYWEPNLFQFHKRIYPKIQLALPVPFQMEGVSRVDDTPAHKALREAIINTLVHACHTGLGNIVIERYPDRLVFSNPGTMLVSVEDYFLGGRSVCRNRTLQKMFMFIGNGERAGSGADTIAQGWKHNNWPKPKIEERFQPDMVDLTLYLGSVGSAENYQETTKKSVREELNSTAIAILDTLASEPSLTAIQVAGKLNLGIDNTRFHIKNLKKNGFLVHVGPDNGGHWKIVKKWPMISHDE